MDALGAARMGDEIAHGAGILGMIAGAVVGAVVAVAVVASVAATGGLALVIFAAMIAGGALAANQILKGLKTIFDLPDPTTGVLASGSPNVFTNSRPAARASLDFSTKCSGGSFPFVTHPLLLPFIPVEILIAEGSKTVTINSMPAARITMHLTCSAFIKTASDNVFIGGPTARTEFVWDITGWLETGFTWLGYAALLGAGVFAAMAGVAAFVGFVAIGATFFAGFEGLGMLGDMVGPGYRDLFQGIAGMGLILAGPKMVKKPGYAYDLSPGDANTPLRFGQKGVSPEFSSKGKFNGADINEVARKLKEGELSPEDVEVQYIWVNGEKVVVNNRSTTVLSKAGIPQEKWVTKDMTGKLPAEGPDSQASVLERLDEMGGKPSDEMPVRETDDRNGPIREIVTISK